MFLSIQCLGTKYSGTCNVPEYNMYLKILCFRMFLNIIQSSNSINCNKSKNATKPRKFYPKMFLEIQKCSASVLVVLAGFLNSAVRRTRQYNEWQLSV